MKADNVALLEFIGASKRTFYIPVYQRNYDWKKMQCATLFKDIEDIAVSTKRNSHFMGTVVYPFLLSVFEDCYIYKNIDKIQVFNTMDVILSYVARRLLCEMPTNALNKVFATMAKDVERYADMQLHEKVILVLAGKKGKVAFPNDNILM